MHDTISMSSKTEVRRCPTCNALQDVMVQEFDDIQTSFTVYDCIYCHGVVMERWGNGIEQ